jgi:2,5-dioxopentanoate dehydrogenase
MEYSNFIGGSWIKSESGETFETHNPAAKSRKIGTFQLSTVDDAKKAVLAARETFPKWRNSPSPERGKILYKASTILEGSFDELSRTLTEEEGKTLPESKAEVQRAIDIFRFFAGEASRIDGRIYSSGTKKTLLYSVREPIGVVALMTPWNFPIAIPSWKMAPALACGNTVVFKPASLTPLIALNLVSSLEKAGLPGGVLNFVSGPGGTVGEELATNPEVDAISFTGSYDVGYGIQKARASSKKMARLQLEMGGKNPTIVLRDAKLDEAATIVSKSAFGLTGQACTATSRAIVDERIKEELVSKIVKLAQETKVGDGLKPETQMGPAVSKSQLEGDRRYIETGKEEGAKILTGSGAKSEKDNSCFEEEEQNGYFIEPTVFDEVFPDMKIAQEEIFGPVLSIQSAKNLDEAIELANKSEYGLTAGLCTSSLSSALEFADKVEAGVVKINKLTTGLELQAPFGGFKKSSSNTFKEQGQEAVDFYTRIKTVYLEY